MPAWSGIDPTIRAHKSLKFRRLLASGGKNFGHSLNLESVSSFLSLFIGIRTFVGMDKQVKNTPIISSHMLQKAAVEHGTAIRHEKNCLTSLSRTQVDILVDTVQRNHPKEVYQYRSLEKKELIIFYLAGVAMGICKRKAEPSMLDMVLREKLDEITLVTTKGNVQREGTRNGRNVGP
ncbi:hypothetical protein Cgig2_014479 [Carnegiea gigantea]|uniref:Uncharacterized protein n=1 Tax=Carnegiea gigantea TaxID=171969 RepID=A0A9Q1JXM3_9CARY|nr:hypothetical protein Cgig2_014479 [Carnegiea gigantea]